MSYADHLFVKNCQDIIEHGISDEEFEVRPKWSDGSPAHTKKLLYVLDKYDLQKDPIPTITLRKQFFKGAVDEILWIYQRQTSDLSELNSHVWDSWNIGDGTIGKAYGYQIGILNKHHRMTRTEIQMEMQFLEDGFYGKFKVDTDDGYLYLNQIGAVIWDLIHDPGSRRIMTNTYNHHDLCEMGLSPCAYSVMFNVTRQGGVNYLNAILYQRSQDMLAANGWNVMQYAALVQMIAQTVGMKPGRFDHMVADMHIYDRHIPVIQDIIRTYRDAQHRAPYDESTEDYQVPFKNPGLWINPDVKSFFDFKPEDLKLIDYEACEFNHKIGNGPGCDVEVAV